MHYICLYIYIYTHTYTRTHTHTHIYIYIHTHTFTTGSRGTLGTQTIIEHERKEIATLVSLIIFTIQQASNFPWHSAPTCCGSILHIYSHSMPFPWHPGQVLPPENAREPGTTGENSSGLHGSQDVSRKMLRIAEASDGGDGGDGGRRLLGASPWRDSPVGSTGWCSFFGNYPLVEARGLHEYGKLAFLLGKTSYFYGHSQ